jgi:hypothetical protein
LGERHGNEEQQPKRVEVFQGEKREYAHDKDKVDGNQNTRRTLW